MKDSGKSIVRHLRRNRSAEITTTIESGLLGRNLSEFLPLTPKEIEVVATCAGNKIAWDNSSPPSSATHENTVRANFLRFLLLGGDARVPVSERGLTVCNAWISGSFDLLTSKIPIAFRFIHCTFEEEIHLIDSQLVDGGHFHKCVIPAIRAGRLHSSRSFMIFDTIVSGVVSLIGARIDGDLICGRSKIGSLIVTDAAIAGRIRLSNGFESAGVVDFSRTKIGGVADLEGAQLNGRGPLALVAVRAHIGGDLIFGKNFRSVGCIKLNEIFIGGSIRGSDGNYKKGEEEAINLDGAKILGSIFMHRVNIEGTFRLLSSRISLDLTLSGAKIFEQEGNALLADRAEIGGGVFMINGFQANGIKLTGLKTGASLSFNGANLTSVGDALALNAQRVSIAGSLTFESGFSSTGKINLVSALVKLNLSFIDSQIVVKQGVSLNCHGINVNGAFNLQKMRFPVDNIVLSSARVGRLADDEKSWGKNISLQGFSYSSLGVNSPFKAAARLKWLDKQHANRSGINSVAKKFAPQPWRQLRKVLLESGHFNDAREIAVAYERRLREAGQIGESSPSTNRIVAFSIRFISNKIHILYGVLIGYGYQPYRLVCWMIAVWLFCGAFFWFSALHNVMAPSNPLIFDNKIYKDCKSESTPGQSIFNLIHDVGKASPRVEKNWYLCPDLAAEYTGFSPLAYSLDVLLPVVDLQQQNDWAPKIPTPADKWYDEFFSLSLEHLTRYVLWFEIIFGWVSSLLLIAVLSGLAKRRDE